jgi:hypothetical protein
MKEKSSSVYLGFGPKSHCTRLWGCRTA